MVPTRITDSNGNNISIVYSNIFQSQRIETIKDTLGRAIIFHYDNNNSNLLTAITAAGVPDQAGNSTTRTLVRLHYKSLFLDYSLFAGLTEQVFNRTISVIDAVYFPGTGNGYWFGDPESYSPYGMIRKVTQQRGMGFSTVSSDPVQSLREQGTVVGGTVTNEQTYSYPQTPQSLNSVPTFGSMVQSWSSMDTTASETSYVIDNFSNPRSVTITQPDETKLVKLSYNYSHLPDTDPMKLMDGRVFQEDLLAPNGTILRRTTTNWELGFRNGPRITRMELTEFENGQTLMKAIVLDYEGGTYNQVMQVREYGLDGALVQTIKTVYAIKNDWDLAQLWPNEYGQLRYDYKKDASPRFLYLPSSVEVLTPDNTPASYVEYGYDETQLQNVDGRENRIYFFSCNSQGCDDVVQQDRCFNPYINSGECMPTGYTADPMPVRGNVTSTTRYVNAASRTGPLTDRYAYDITGNVITETSAGNLRKSYVYNRDTGFGYATSKTVGSAADSSARISTSSTYNFNTGLELSTTDANLRTSTAEFSTATWRPTKTTSATGATTLYLFSDSTLSYEESTYENNGNLAGKTISRLSGIGQVRRQERLSAVNPDVWDAVETKFDKFGRVAQRSLPFRIGSDPAAIKWVQTQYDDRGRVRKIIAGDGSEMDMVYNESARPQGASSELGLTVKRTDPWGRQRWWRSDSQERLVETVEPDPGGNGSVSTGGLITTYKYDVLGNLIEVNQGVQHRVFKYDSVSRLTHQKLAEANATLDAAGNVASPGSGLWSDYFSYDERSNISSRVDARGAKTTLSYLRPDGQPDPLNRLQSVSYDSQGAPDVLSAPTVNFTYVPTGDVTRALNVTTSGVISEQFGYDSEGRIAERNVTFLMRLGQPMSVSYRYDSLNRLTDTIYPQQYGLPNDPRKTAQQSYDVASRLSGLSFNQTTYASQIGYNAASQTTSLKVGLPGANQVTETYDYSSDTGLLRNQTVTRGSGASAAVLLDLDYDYLLPGTSTGRTSQVTRLINNRNHNKDRSYSYDALGRLIQAQGGPATSALWTQTYGYDNYGNRTSVTASGNSAANFLTNPNSNLEIASAKSSQELDLPPDLLSKSNIETLSRNNRATVREESEPISDSPPTLLAPPPQSGPPTFIDDPLNDPQNPEKTAIKSIHITELRAAIDALRARLGMSPYSWQAAAAPGDWIKPDPILEMRTALDQALGQPPAPGYSAGLAQGQPILAIHIQELRDRVKSAWNSSAAIPRDGLANLSYDQATNRITTSGFAYDASGNLTRALSTSGTWQRYQYDAAGRLVTIKNDDNQIFESYTYGYLRQRVITQYGSENSNQRTYYIWGAAGVIAEYSETETQPAAPIWSRSYIYLSTTLLATQEWNGAVESVQFHHPDRVGTRVMTNSQSGTSFEQVTLPFGTSLGAESTGFSNRRFASYQIEA